MMVVPGLIGVVAVRIGLPLLAHVHPAILDDPQMLTARLGWTSTSIGMACCRASCRCIFSRAKPLSQPMAKVNPAHLRKLMVAAPVVFVTTMIAADWITDQLKSAADAVKGHTNKLYDGTKFLPACPAQSPDSIADHK